MNLAGSRRPKWTEKPYFGCPQVHTASAYETFRTVSLGSWVNKGKMKDRGLAAPSMPTCGYLPFACRYALAQVGELPYQLLLLASKLLSLVERRLNP